MERRELERFNAASDKVRRATLRTMFAWAIYNPSMSFIGGIGFILVIGLNNKFFIKVFILYDNIFHAKLFPNR